MRSRYRSKVSHNSEFDLDLAPLLAVMVKLVPVLLLSSAFVQVMMIESDLPQVVKEAIQREENTPSEKKTTLTLELSKTKSSVLTISKQTGQNSVQIENLNDGQINYNEIHKALFQAKSDNPEVFRLELNPDPQVSYKEIVRVMDEARRSKDLNKSFDFEDPKTGKVVNTNFMFPDVVFANILE